MVDKQEVDYNPVTAQVAIANTYAAPVNDDAELAEEAGVTNGKNVDYEEALRNYESRADVETLANRRAREGAASFDEQSFARTADPEGVVTASSATHEDVEAAEKSKRQQATATADAAADRNEPVAEVPQDDKKED